jgi:uncharacterized protein (UPF0332 family)
MTKAAQAASSARLLLDSGDADGACNRAYYAMFDAARSALMARGHPPGKTHRGILAAFSDQMVRSGALPKDLGRFLKRAETYRFVADYGSDSVTLDEARVLVGEAERFIAAIREWITPDEQDTSSEDRSTTGDGE